ncbi:MAG TPA: ABC transporter substrate-binding protein, partial [Ktedonobacterales bacterium]
MSAHGRISRAFVLVAGVVVLLAGCALPWQQATGPQPLPDAQQVFRPFMPGPKNGDLDSLDPARIEFGTDYNVAQLIFPPLVTLNDHNQVAPWAAERWEPSADGLTWTFHLRAGMRWSDGVPIDASTYAYSINRSLDRCTASYVSYYLSGTGPELITGSVAFSDYIAHPCPNGATASPETLIGKSILAPDPQTLVLRLSHPAAYFPMALTYPTAWAQPRQLIERYGATFNASGDIIFHWTEHLVGFGGNLFTVKRWDHAGHLDLVR